MSKPTTILVGPDKYRATVLKIVDKDDDGVARQLVMVRADEVVHLQGGEEFLIAYVSVKMLEPS